MGLSPLLLIHICAGTVGLLSGTVAIAVRKGSRTHAKSGIVFSISMLTLAATGAYIAYSKSQTSNLLAGVLTFYMIATAWMTARRRERGNRIVDWVALLVALAVGASCVVYGFRVAHGLATPSDGVPAGMDFFFGFVVLIAAAGDSRMLAHGGFSGAQRIARHLWRMSFGLFVASGSFFMGRQRIFPAFIRQSNILIVLTILPLFLLIFWLIRVRFTKLYQQKFNPSQQHDYSVSARP